MRTLMPDEIKYLSYATQYFQENPVLIDAGMNKGDFSQEFLNRCPSCTIFGFEPIPELIKEAYNRFAGIMFIKVFAYQFLLGSDFSSNSIINKCQKGLESSSVYKRDNFLGYPFLVPTLTLDFFSGVFPEKIDYFKLDVEGAELEVLKGSIEILASKRIRFIQFEVGDDNGYTRSLQNVGEFLGQYGYIIKNENLEVLKDFMRPYNIEVQNYLAELVI